MKFKVNSSLIQKSSFSRNLKTNKQLKWHSSRRFCSQLSSLLSLHSLTFLKFNSSFRTSQFQKLLRSRKLLQFQKHRQLQRLQKPKHQQPKQIVSPTVLMESEEAAVIIKTNVKLYTDRERKFANTFHVLH